MPWKIFLPRPRDEQITSEAKEICAASWAKHIEAV